MSQDTVTKAASIGDIEVLAKMIQNKANIEERSGMAGNTPLHCAARANQFEAVKLLLESKSDVNAQRKADLLTPLHSASHAGNLTIVEYLVAAGAKYWLLDKKNNTPCDVAKRVKNTTVVEFLAALPERKPEDTKAGKQRKSSLSTSPEPKRPSLFQKIFAQRGPKKFSVLNGVGDKIKQLVQKVTVSRTRSSSATYEASAAKESPKPASADATSAVQPEEKSPEEKNDFPPVPPLDDRSMADTWLKLTGDVSCDDTLEVYRRCKEQKENPHDKQILKDMPRTVAVARVGGRMEQIRCQPTFDHTAHQRQDLPSQHAALFDVCRAVAVHPLSTNKSNPAMTVGYVQGMNVIAAFLFAESGGDGFRTWQLLVRLLHHPRCALSRLFQTDLPGLALAEYQVTRCGELRLMSLLQHLRALMLEPISWLSQWLMTLFCKRYEELLSRGIRQMYHVIFEQGWTGVVRLLVAMLQHSEQYLVQCDFDDAMEFFSEGIWQTLDFRQVAAAARYSDVSAEELTQYELVFATSQMRTRSFRPSRPSRPVPTQHPAPSVKSSQSEEALDVVDDVIASLGAGAATADAGEVADLRSEMREIKKQRDQALEALGKSEACRRELKEASREAAQRTASVMDVFTAQQTARSKTSMELQRQIIDLKREVKVLKGAQAHREHAGELLRTEASLLKRFDQLLLLHTQQKGAEDLRSKVREFTSQQAILMATMKTSRRVEDRVRVALALKHAVRQNQLQRSSRLAQSSTRAGWIPEDADVHTIEDMEMTDYYQIIGKRIRVATHSSSPPAAAAASTTPIKNKSTWDLASNIEGRVCPLNVRGSDMSKATEGVNSIVFRALAKTDAGDAQSNLAQVVLKGQLPLARTRSDSYEEWLQQYQGHEYELQSLVPWSPFVVPLLHSFEGSSSLLWAWVPDAFKLLDTAHHRTTYAVMPYYPGTLKTWFDRFRQSSRLRQPSSVGLFSAGIFRSRAKSRSDSVSKSRSDSVSKSRSDSVSKSRGDDSSIMKSAQPSAKSEAALVSKISVEQRKQFGRVVAKVLLQLCSAISDIQKAHIVHRDLKADNVFVDEEGFVKIGDFGCAKQYKRYSPTDTSESSGAESAEDVPLVASEQVSEKIGAQCAQPPEVMRVLHTLPNSNGGMPTLRHVFGKADVFATARMLWEICCGSPSARFPDTSAARPANVTCDLLVRKHRTVCVSFPQWFDVRLRVVLTSLLQWDPQERMSADMAAFQLQLLLYGPPSMAQLRQEFVGGLGQQIGDRVLLRQWLCRERTAAILGSGDGVAASANMDASSRYLRETFLLGITDGTLYSILAEQKRLEQWYYDC